MVYLHSSKRRHIIYFVTNLLKVECQAHQGLTVGSFLLRYLVVCTVESLSLFHLLFISSFLCTWRKYMYIDKLGIFYVNQTYMCLDPHQGEVGTV